MVTEPVAIVILARRERPGHLHDRQRRHTATAGLQPFRFPQFFPWGMVGVFRVLAERFGQGKEKRP